HNTFPPTDIELTTMFTKAIISSTKINAPNKIIPILFLGRALSQALQRMAWPTTLSPLCSVTNAPERAGRGLHGQSLRGLSVVSGIRKEAKTMPSRFQAALVALNRAQSPPDGVVQYRVVEMTDELVLSTC